MPPATVSIQKSPDKRDLRYIKLITGRMNGIPEDEIAANAKCDSPAELYQKLARDGFPICGVCGSTHPEPREGHCDKSKRRPQGTKRKPQELPSANDAAALLKERVEWLNRALDHLPFMEQWLKDGNFVTEGVYPKESQKQHMLFRREDFGKSKLGQRSWERECKRYGQNPETAEFSVPIARVLPDGTAWYPGKFLLWLVTAYAITDGPLEHLLERLHPAPEDWDTEAVNAKREELLLKAKQLAGLVRGNRKAIGRGPKTEGATPGEQMDAWNLDRYEKHGWPVEDLGLSQEVRKNLSKLRLPHTDPYPE